MENNRVTKDEIIKALNSILLFLSIPYVGMFIMFVLSMWFDPSFTIASKVIIGTGILLATILAVFPIKDIYLRLKK